MYNPLVSIIIPVYNGSNYLKESIDSALAQTYNRIEVIVINDGSQDDRATEMIALSYGDKIRYFYKENGGVATALNFGIEKMKGEWFSWLSHDDLYLPNKISSAIEIINSKKIDINNTIISCEMELINSKGEPIFRVNRSYLGLFSGKEMFKSLCVGNNLSGCSLLIPKIALKQVKGFNPDYKYIQDWVCWIMLSFYGYNFYLYNDKLIKSRVHSMQDTITLAKLQPIEINQFLNNFLYKLGSNISANKYYLRTLLFYFCTKINNKNIRYEYKVTLKKYNLYNLTDEFRYYVYLLKGIFLCEIKKKYRSIINKKYRGTK